MQMVETELVRALSSRLDEVSPEQAANGAGLIFRLLKHKLDDQDFATLDTVIPESDELAAQAPHFEDTSLVTQTLGGVNPALGGSQLAQLGHLAALTSSFARLGLKPDLVPEFVAEILDYIQQQGGEQIRNLVEKVLKA